MRFVSFVAKWSALITAISGSRISKTTCIWIWIDDYVRWRQDQLQGSGRYRTADIVFDEQYRAFECRLQADAVKADSRQAAGSSFRLLNG